MKKTRKKTNKTATMKRVAKKLVHPVLDELLLVPGVNRFLQKGRNLLQWQPKKNKKPVNQTRKTKNSNKLAS